MQWGGGLMCVMMLHHSKKCYLREDLVHTFFVCFQMGSFIFADNSDLLAVTVTPTSREGQQPRQRRFLVVDVYQIVLVEPDSTRLGWGVATFVGFLQDLEVVTDKEDSRCLHVTVHSPGSSYVASGASPAHMPASKSAPMLSATFAFDDHIRCMAAKQRCIIIIKVYSTIHIIYIVFFRLTKGRIKARQRKMHQIARLLELPGNVGPSCPSPPALNLSLVRQQDEQRESLSNLVSHPGVKPM
jgi:protein CLEC16A